MVATTNCKACGTLVWKTDAIRGTCWRCEIKRLRADNKRLAAELAKAEAAVDGHCFALFETLARLKLIVLYYGSPEVKAAVDAFNGPEEIDWLQPPAAVDENLERLEHFKAGLKKMFGKG